MEPSTPKEPIRHRAGDYVRWDGTIPHDGESTSDGAASMLIIRIRPKD